MATTNDLLFSTVLRAEIPAQTSGLGVVIPPIAVILGKTPPWIAFVVGALSLGGVYLARHD